MQNDAQKCACHINTKDWQMHWLFMYRHLHTWMLLLPVVELLWSSPGIHFSFTLLLLCSDSTKFSGASGTSENHHNNIGLENHRHINLCNKKRPREQMFNQIIPRARGCGTSCMAATVSFRSGVNSIFQGYCETQQCTDKAMVCMSNALLWLSDILIRPWMCHRLM